MPLTKNQIKERLKEAGSKEENKFKKGIKITATNSFQKNYTYTLSKNYGDIADLQKKYNFFPYYTPKEMLEMGIFGGKYITEIGAMAEFPKEWFINAKLSDKYEPALNFFKVKASNDLADWNSKGWIKGEDKHGWFIWYCRTYIGRRDNVVDEFQIKRWKGIRRHEGQIIANCEEKDLKCRPGQRQVLLHWSRNCKL